MRGQSSLGLLNLSPELTHSSLVGRNVDIVLALVLLDEVVDDSVVKVLSSEVSVTGGGQDLENTVLNGKERDIESSSSQVVDDDLGLGLSRSVKAVGWESVHDSAEYRSGLPIAAAVGSLTIRRTVRPAMVPASLVADR